MIKYINNIINMEHYLIEYIDKHLEKTYDPNDKILSCSIQHDALLIAKHYSLFYSSHRISKLLLKDTNIKRKVCGGSQYYIGLKYKEDVNDDMYYWRKNN